MILWNTMARGWLVMVAVSVLSASMALGQQPRSPLPYGHRPSPNQIPVRPRVVPSERVVPPGMTPRVAERSSAASLLTPRPNEHPLMPALRWARQGIKEVANIQDYSFTMVKRERVGGKISDYQHMFVKIRHKPFSVYMYFLGPEDVAGQEVIWVQGRNGGLMQAHGTGLKRTMFGTVSLKPTGPIAMKGQRYPLTEIGLLNMLRRLVEVGEADTKYGECEVKFFEGAKVNDRSCTCIQVVHPVPRRNFLFHVARIFVDDELNLPVRYEAYDWPKHPGDGPQLSEEYTYLNLKINNGFTDADFDVRNSNYQFP